MRMMNWIMETISRISVSIQPIALAYPSLNTLKPDSYMYWNKDTEKSLGYIHLNVKPVLTNEITIRLKGASKEGDGFGQIVD